MGRGRQGRIDLGHVRTRPGTSRTTTTATVANDHFHRYEEDVALIESARANAYRFSIAWPRIFPDGTGTRTSTRARLLQPPRRRSARRRGRAVRDALPLGSAAGAPGRARWLAVEGHGAGIRRLRRLRGGAARRPREHYFRSTSSRRSWKAATRESTCRSAAARRCTSGRAGLELSDSELKQVRHHAVLGHGLAVQAIRAGGPAGAKSGSPRTCGRGPAPGHPEYVQAAEQAPATERRLHDGHARRALHRRIPRRGGR